MSKKIIGVTVGTNINPKRLEEYVKNGKSAYELAVENGFNGTEQEWLASLNGKDGYTPVKGKDYFDGEDGVDGKDGYTPIKGVDYFDGKDGVDGIDGKDGYTPVKGIDYFTEADKTEIVNDVIKDAEIGILKQAFDYADDLADDKLDTSIFNEYSDAHASDYTNKQIDDQRIAWEEPAQVIEWDGLIGNKEAILVKDTGNSLLYFVKLSNDYIETESLEAINVNISTDNMLSKPLTIDKNDNGYLISLSGMGSIFGSAKEDTEINGFLFTKGTYACTYLDKSDLTPTLYVSSITTKEYVHTIDIKYLPQELITQFEDTLQTVNDLDQTTVKTTPQTLTDDQKAQAQDNIGLVDGTIGKEKLIASYTLNEDEEVESNLDTLLGSKITITTVDGAKFYILKKNIDLSKFASDKAINVIATFSFGDQYQYILASTDTQFGINVGFIGNNSAPIEELFPTFKAGGLYQDYQNIMYKNNCWIASTQNGGHFKQINETLFIPFGNEGLTIHNQELFDEIFEVSDTFTFVVEEQNIVIAYNTYEVVSPWYGISNIPYDEKYFLYCVDRDIESNVLWPYIANGLFKSVQIDHISIIPIDPKYLPTLTSTPDWNENDPEAEGYIKNRPFYDEEVEKEYVVSEVDWVKVMASGQEGIPTENPLEVGKEYTITMNGISRKYIAKETFAEDDGLMRRGIYLGDDPNDQENIVHGSSYIDVPDFGLTGMTLTDPDIVLRDWGVDVSTVTSMVVKVTGTRKEKVPHPMSGKYVEDGYWSERYIDDKVYIDGVNFSYGVNTPEGIGPDEYPTYNGDFGESGHRIVTIGGHTYEADILTYTFIYEGRKFEAKVLGNPSEIIYKFIFMEIGEYTESDFPDNGLPFTLTQINNEPITLENFDGKELWGHDARAEESYDEELLALNQACLDALSCANPITIIGADNIETIHHIPEKYLPENAVLTEEVAGDNETGQVYIENAELAYADSADSGSEHYPEFIVDNIIDAPGMKLVEFPCGKFEAPLYYGSTKVEDEGEIIGEIKFSLLGNPSKLKNCGMTGEMITQMSPDIPLEDNGLPFLLIYSQGLDGRKALGLWYADDTHMMSLSESEEEFQQKREILSRYSTVTISDLATTTERKVPKDFLYKPDWNQNNPEAGDYIENRPFYGDDEITIIPEQLFMNIAGGTPIAVDTLMEIGKTYRVTLGNGVSKDFVAYEKLDSDGESTIIIGDDPFFAAFDTGIEYGFSIITAILDGSPQAVVIGWSLEKCAVLFNFDLSEAATLTAKLTSVPTIKRMSGKYIEDGYYTEQGRPSTIYLQDAVFEYSRPVEELGLDYYPEYAGTLGAPGKRIVTINGTSYDAEVIPYDQFKYIGNPGFLTPDFSDNGLPFLILERQDPNTLMLFGLNGQWMEGVDSSVPDYLEKNQALVELAAATRINIISPKEEIVHTVPEKYLPILEQKKIETKGKVWLDKVVFEYEYPLEEVITDDVPTALDVFFGTEGKRIVEFANGERYEADIQHARITVPIDNDGTLEEIEIDISILGNPSYSTDFLYGYTDLIDTTDNGMSFSILSTTITMLGESKMLLLAVNNQSLITEVVNNDALKYELVKQYSPITIREPDINKTVNKIKEEYLPISTPDWEENNPASSSYIKNRPFYEDASQIVEEEIVLPESLLTTWIEKPGEPAPVDILMVAGETYRVTCNGVSKEFVAKEFTPEENVSVVYIGDDFESYVTDYDNFTPEVGFISATTNETGTKTGAVLPIDLTLFMQLFNITSEEQFTTATVKQTHVMHKPFIKQMDGKFIKDMYYEDPDRAEVIEENVILPDMTYGELLEMDGPIIVSGYVFEVGHTYQFTCNGVTLELECYEGMVEGTPFRVIGDKMDSNTGQSIEIKCGFVWINANAGQWILMSEITDEEKAAEIFGEVTEDTVFNIKERIVKPFIKQIDPKFIRDMYYEEEGITYNSIVTGVTIQQITEGIPTQNYVLTEGKDYLITINGISVTSKCIGIETTKALGYILNQNGEPGDIPYGIVILNTLYEDSYVLYSLVANPEKAIATFGEVSATTTGSISEIVPTTIHHIPPKYIKDMYYEEEGGEEKRVILEDFRFGDIVAAREYRLSLEADKRYSIIINGTEVHSTANIVIGDGNFVIYIGDYPNTPGGYGFSIWETSYNNQGYTLQDITDESIFIDRYGGSENPLDSIITISELVPVPIVHQIPEKYIPDSAKGMSAEEKAKLEKLTSDLEQRVGNLETTIGSLNAALENTLEGVDS